MRAVARLAFLICVAAATLLPTRAMGFGAVAEGQGEAPTKWIAIGWELNAKSQSEADQSAIGSCEEVKASGGYRGASCRIVATFSAKCLAVANSKEGTLGVGWGVNANPQAAEREALDRCRERALRDGVGSCTLARATVCDKPPEPDYTPVIRAAAAVAVTGAAGVLLWNLAGGATIPALNILAGILGLAGAVYLFFSFTTGDEGGGGMARDELGQAINTARTAMHVSFGVAIASAMAILLTLLWASKRVRAMQVAIDRMKSGASRIFIPKSSISGTRSSVLGTRSSVAGTTGRATYGPATGHVGSTRSGLAAGARETRAGSSDGAMLLQPKDGTRAIVLDPRLLQSAGVVIGRHQSCDVVLNDENVSGRHARLFMDRSGTLRIEDLGSTNGTWRDGVQIKTASLRPGSILKLGRTEYTVKISL